MTWPLYSLVAQDDLARLLTDLAAEETAVRRLDGTGVTSGEALWRAAGEQLGFADVAGWDSFADRMWGAVLPDDDEGDRVALVWEHADALVATALGDLLAAFDALVTLGRGAYAQDLDVSIFLLGDGPSFPPLR